MTNFQNLIWIQGDTSCEAPQFRKVFSVQKEEEAKISICGLGFFELYLNGRRVSDDRFVPAWSNYEKRDLSTLLYPIHDEFTRYRTYYREYDLSEYLTEGEKCFGDSSGKWLVSSKQKKCRRKAGLWLSKTRF